MKVTRRQWLRWLGASAVGAGALAARAWAPWVVEASEANQATDGPGGTVVQETAHQWCMVIDLRKCEGCVTIDKPPACKEACAKEHYVPRGQEWLAVYEKELPGGGTYFMPRPCMQCENAPCAKVCPVRATFYSPEGIVLINHDRCIGCRLCMAACPYEARYFNWGDPDPLPPEAALTDYSPEYPVPSRRGTVNKCMFCAHHLRHGKLSACAQACPMGAIYMGDLVTDKASNGKEAVALSTLLAENEAYQYKEKLGTRPRVYYLPGHGQEFGRTPR